MHDDSDIKIFTGKTDDSDGSDLLAVAEEIKRQRLNGNYTKAKQLGEALADLSPENSIIGSELKELMCERVIPLDVKLQLKILMLFCSEYTLIEELPPFISAAASDAMFDRLRAEAEGFYDTVSGGAAFTFYYLAVRKRDIVSEIGDSFAMLCNSENNAGIKALGCKTFELTCKRVSELVSECKFEK